MAPEVTVVEVTDAGHSLNVISKREFILHKSGSGEHTLSADVVRFTVKLFVDILHTDRKLVHIIGLEYTFKGPVIVGGLFAYLFITGQE